MGWFKKECGACGGSGLKSVTCYRCHGNGKVHQERYWDTPKYDTHMETCDVCSGDGSYPRTCSRCDGTGHL